MQRFRDPRSRALRRLSPDEGSTVRLFCFPYAGGGAYLFRPWAATLPSTVALFAVQPPGREDRIVEPPATKLSELVDELADDIAAGTTGEFAFFGHSLGAIVAAEVALRLSSVHGRTAQRLFVSGCRPLPMLQRNRQPVSELSDAGLLDHIRKLGGTPEEVLADPGMLTLILRLVRADYALFDGYRYQDVEPLTCPITAVGGSEDVGTPPEILAGWSEITTGPTEVEVLPGGHFFLHSARDPLLQLITDRLSAPTQNTA